MADNLSPEQRTVTMRNVKSKNTSAEIAVRQICRELGHRGYRLHRKDVPGKPDITFMGRKIVIFVHGCFWHGHNCPAGTNQPKTNRDYWLQKIERNKQRDAVNMAALEAAGWRCLVVWECEIKQRNEIKTRIGRFLG